MKTFLSILMAFAFIAFTGPVLTPAHSMDTTLQTQDEQGARHIVIKAHINRVSTAKQARSEMENDSMELAQIESLLQSGKITKADALELRKSVRELHKMKVLYIKSM
jgi:hypothetical protein